MNTNMTLIIVWIGLLSGCSTREVQYVNPMDTRSTTTDLNNADFARMSRDLIDRLNHDPTLGKELEDQAVVLVGGIENRTYDHLDTDTFAANVRNLLHQSGRFKVIDRKRVDDILDQWEMRKTGLVDRATAMRVGKLLDAQYLIAGSVSSTFERRGKTKDVSYLLSLELLSLENGEILWSGQTAIRKLFKRPGFAI